MAVPIQRRSEMRRLATQAEAQLTDASPTSILTWAFETFGDRVAIASSMADTVVIDLASSIASEIDVIFLDTGYHFAETLETRDKAARRYGLSLHSVDPKQTIDEQDQLFGPDLFARDSDACCSLRKVEPLRRALDPFDAWISGIRRDESASRAGTRVVEWEEARSLVKINPIVMWTQADIDAYVAEHDVITNPLLERGYPSIGCAPCTRRVADGDDPRSGRWAGSGKTECGLHVDSDGSLQPP